MKALAFYYLCYLIEHNISLMLFLFINNQPSKVNMQHKPKLQPYNLVKSCWKVPSDCGSNIITWHQIKVNNEHSHSAWINKGIFRHIDHLSEGNDYFIVIFVVFDQRNLLTIIPLWVSYHLKSSWIGTWKMHQNISNPYVKAVLYLFIFHNCIKQFLYWSNKF